MTNEELKKKIVDIVRYWYVNEKDYGYIFDFHIEEKINAIADALIAAGYGDVKEAEHRAARAERALKNFAENITCEDCPYFSDCASSEKMEDLIHSDYCFAEYLRQAEKELAEEEKDENI